MVSRRERIGFTANNNYVIAKRALALPCVTDQTEMLRKYR